MIIATFTDFGCTYDIMKDLKNAKNALYRFAALTILPKRL